MSARLHTPRLLAVLPFVLVALAGSGTPPALAATDCSLTSPANVAKANDFNQAGAVTTYSAPTTNGTCNTIVCTPPSGAFFPLGTVLITCTSSTTPAAKTSLTVTVNDLQAPTLTPPPNQTANTDPGQANAAVTLPNPTASDNAPGVKFACDHATGSLFPIGTTQVTCTAFDKAGNTTAGAYNVIVKDNEAPVVEAAPDVRATVPAAATGGAVSFATPGAHDNSTAAPSVSCAPASGSTFAVGSTSVTCTASDAAGNAGTRSFAVIVEAQAAEPAPVIEAGWLLDRKFRTRTSLGFVLSKAATVGVVIQRCRGKKCSGLKPAAGLIKISVAGRNVIAFSRTIGKRTLTAGRYRAVLTAVDAGGQVTIKPLRVAFTVLRR